MESADHGLAKQDRNAKSQARMLMQTGAFVLKVFTMWPFYLYKKLSGKSHKYTLPKWLDNAVFYQIYPQSFNDTNGDGIGDIQGIIEKLDYLKGLGVDALWLNPLFDSPFKDAGYDVRDFIKVAERYGSNEDLKRLFDEAKKKNIRVVLDLVAGHCSDEHEWFKASANNETTAENDKFIWTPTKWIIEIAQMVKSHYKREGYYRKNFYDCQPALNFGYGIRIPFLKWEQGINDPAPLSTRQALKEIIEFWMDLGASGFRVDMAQSLVKRDFGFVKTLEIWRDIRDWFEAKWPEGVLLSEWGFPDASIMSGFHIDFALPWAVEGAPAMTFNETGTYPFGECYFHKDGNGSAHKFISNFLTQREKSKGHGLFSIPTANHDFQRPACGSRNSDDQLKGLMLYNLTFSDLPVIYYGDEIGLKYLEGMPNKEGSRVLGRFNRAGSRTPMQWSKEKNAGFSLAGADQLYLPVDSNPDYPNVAEQEQNRESLLNFSRQVIEIKKSTDVFTRHGDLKVLNGHHKNEYPLVYLRESFRDKYLVVINPTDMKQNCNVHIDVQSASLLIGQGVSVHQKSIQCEPVAFAMFKLT
jgi:maltose alpha-D-glucosyltransferase/alpha-amylase